MALISEFIIGAISVLVKGPGLTIYAEGIILGLLPPIVQEVCHVKKMVVMGNQDTHRSNSGRRSNMGQWYFKLGG